MKEFDCPFCQTRLLQRGWTIPGMRAMADLGCEKCGRQYYGDLPSGQALYTPMLLDRSTGHVFDFGGPKWFARWLAKSFAERVDVPRTITTRQLSPIGRNVILLNCLDAIYGHSLLKLLNAQRYIGEGSDLILLLPRRLEWLVPDGVAQVWIVDIPAGRGEEWNEWLSREIHQRLKSVPKVQLSSAHSHPHPDNYDIGRFSRVAPFVVSDWQARAAKPVVTFIWRDDRVWAASRRFAVKGMLARVATRLARGRDAQTRNVIELAHTLRESLPGLDIAVVGIGTRGGLPGWIQDERRSTPDKEDETRWCERYATSHVVVGVHGSNMLLPSAHAGAVVELMPPDREGNVLQDLLVRGNDSRDLLFRYRLVPLTASPDHVGAIVTMIVNRYPEFVKLMGRTPAIEDVVLFSRG